VTIYSCRPDFLSEEVIEGNFENTCVVSNDHRKPCVDETCTRILPVCVRGDRSRVEYQIST
jgi:hypothetical protein